MKRIFKIFRTLFVFCLASLLSIIILVPSILYVIFPVKWSMTLGGKHWQLFCWVALRLLMGVKIVRLDFRGPNFRKRVIGSGLVICNHQSLFDIPLYMLSFSCAPIMKKEILKIPIIGLVALANGAIPLNRTNPHSRKFKD